MEIILKIQGRKLKKKSQKDLKDKELVQLQTKIIKTQMLAMDSGIYLVEEEELMEEISIYSSLVALDLYQC